MNRSHVLVLSLILPLSGCAYFTNYTRAVDLKSGSISIDVKQRVVFSQQHASSKNVVVCAEPSPDALTVIGASGGLAIANPAGNTANLSAALSESGSSIGLRTQSIQLLRDAMYRLCEGYAAGAVNTDDFSAMQRRYQSTMMGLIAIEQLTGPIVASQAMLMSRSDAGAGASAGDGAVTAAATNAETAGDATLEAQTELDTAQTALTSTRDEMKSSGEKLRSEQSKRDTKKDFDQATVDALQARLVALISQEKTQLNDVADKQRRLDDKKKRQAIADADLRSARSRVSAQASGAGRFGDVASAARGSNEAFAKAVVEIVSEINSSYSRDSCLALVSDLINRIPQGSIAVTAKDPRVEGLEQALAVATEKFQDAIRLFNKELDELSLAEARKGPPVELAMRRAVAESASRRVSQAQQERDAAAAALRDTRRSEASPNTVLVTGLEVCQQILRLQSKESTAKTGTPLLTSAQLDAIGSDPAVLQPKPVGTRGTAQDPPKK